MTYPRSQSVPPVSAKYVVSFQEQLEAEATMQQKSVKQHIDQASM